MDVTNTKTRGKMVNSFNPADLSALDDTTRSMVTRRGRLLGPAYRLFYRNPVEISRAKGVLLYDRHGNEFLDAYNNVVSVGHAHPRVIEAVTRQMEILCTHTRYLQDSILDYAEDLLGTYEGRIGASGHAMFTCKLATTGAYMTDHV